MQLSTSAFFDLLQTVFSQSQGGHPDIVLGEQHLHLPPDTPTGRKQFTRIAWKWWTAIFDLDHYGIRLQNLLKLQSSRV